jgi:chemotaxis protein histidine kinase CheA
MGQGLFIARQIFAAHGGTVSIKSTPDVGTAAYMTLPLTASEPLSLAADMEGETVQITVDADRHSPMDNR